jgi:hypothetical protein
MSFIVMPYLGPGAAAAELSRPLPARSAPRRRDTLEDPLDEVPIRLTYRTMRVLVAVGAHPGLKNSEVSGRAGISDEGQASRLPPPRSRRADREHRRRHHQKRHESLAAHARRRTTRALDPAGDSLRGSFGRRGRPRDRRPHRGP